mmetsp:Transcript_17086/g.48101  ORF Transcript_17086/g.48101 Transcript_17086/m.48101 type:complete len:421 (+) Transcript_17086:145-1407(+)|eukprot:CAMPEP_0119139870 /NCGR_PEP_ID=MMETSP1310-20130426/28276_1 /TAXON_ID=464262 /ORGANISM="Genus nov. species nov., Strain RCC2339" /LENGTH=420 /DNA_ID=CAMNT_0007131195 /DNA_START=66 /DNA_END=1328 /DNA_ORIENTATION=+
MAEGEYLEWLRGLGVKVERYEWKRCDGDGGKGLCLCAKEAVAEGVAAVRAPIALAVSAESLVKHGETEAGDYLRGGGRSCTELVVMWLMRRRFFPGERDGKWDPYIRHLPATFHDPLHWNEEELSNLRGTNLASAFPSYRARVKAHYDAAFTAVHTHNPTVWSKLEVTWERWLWGWSALHSRALPIRLLADARAERRKSPPRKKRRTAQGRDDRPLQGGEFADILAGMQQEAGEQEPLMLPLLDSTNHVRLAKVRWESSPTEVQLYVEGRSLAEGEEIVNNYGSKEDEEMLLVYGFVEESGKPVYPLKLAGGDGRWGLREDDPLPEGLVATLSTMILRGGGDDSLSLQDLSDCDQKEVELEAVAVINNLLSARLQELDPGLVSKQGDPYRVRLASLYRDGQRRCVELAIQETLKRLSPQT